MDEPRRVQTLHSVRHALLNTYSAFGARFAGYHEQLEMDETGPNLPMYGTLTPTEAQRMVEASQQLFNRTLAGWASDVLSLRRAGLDRPGWCDGEPPIQWTKAA